MDIQTFIQNFQEAFGEKAELPLVFWYSDTQEGTAGNFRLFHGETLPQ